MKVLLRLNSEASVQYMGSNKSWHKQSTVMFGWSKVSLWDKETIDNSFQMIDNFESIINSICFCVTSFLSIKAFNALMPSIISFVWHLLCLINEEKEIKEKCKRSKSWGE